MLCLRNAQLNWLRAFRLGAKVKIKKKNSKKDNVSGKKKEMVVDKPEPS